MKLTNTHLAWLSVVIANAQAQGIYSPKFLAAFQTFHSYAQHFIGEQCVSLFFKRHVVFLCCNDHTKKLHFSVNKIAEVNNIFEASAPYDITDEEVFALLTEQQLAELLD